MNAINWPQYGLKDNPYTFKPLSEGGDIPIDKAFIGRDRELKYLESLFLSNDNLSMTISGDVGVGKTSLINFHKYKFKQRESSKVLFSFRREIEANIEILNKRAFLIEIMGSVLSEIHLLDKALLDKEPVLKRLQKIVDISTSVSYSGGLSGGFESLQAGVSFGRDVATDHPLHMPMTTLELYFVDLLTFIRTKKINGINFQGLIVHVNNFDALLYDSAHKRQVIAFFHEIRDIMQTNHTYFVFLGPRNFFKDIIATQQRVKGIFVQTPLMLEPLSRKEIVQAFDERMNLLRSDNVSTIIKPFEESVIYELYDLFHGDIRSMMSAMKDILGQNAHVLGKTLSVNEALMLLGRERWERIQNTAKLTQEQTAILTYLAAADGYVSQKDLAKALHKTKESLSGYYFKVLKENGIIEEKKKVGTTKYWGLTKAYYPLRFLVTVQKSIDDLQ